MAVFDDLITVIPNQTDVSSDKIVLPQAPSPMFSNTGEQQEQSSIQDSLSSWNSQPASMTAKMSPITFDWESTQADRYVQDRHLKDLGFEPYAGTEMHEGKPYNVNELRYGAVQTFGDVMSKAAGGFAGITAQSFTESWHGTGKLLNAIFGAPWSDQTFKERLMGDPEDLAQLDKEQKAIFNKYAIYHTPESDNSTLNKQFLGDVIQQMGFTVGTVGEFLLESALTWGIGEGVSAALKGTKWAMAGAEAISQGAKVVPIAERINDARKVGNIWKNTPLMESIVQDAKGMTKAATQAIKKSLNPLTGIDDISKMIEAGASGTQVALTSVGAAKRLFSQVNMAATEARFEAAGTFGQMYGDLVAKYQDRHDGQMPVGKDLENIQATAYGASTDNFIVNTGLLMTMNQIQFGNLFSKFSSSSKLLRGALESGDKAAFTVTGKALGKQATKMYESGALGAIGQFGKIRKDFGLGTALWQVAKRSATGTAAKFEVTEGLQEILQESSNTTLRDYYTNLYDGGKDLEGASILNADWSKGLAEQYNRDGWKTFLMGAVTGLAMSPLQASVMYGTKKGYAKMNDQYKGELDQKKKVLQENINAQNSFYKNIGNALNEHIANTKIQGQAGKNIEEAVASGDRCQYNNAKNDALTKAVAAAIKTDNYDSLIDTIKEYAENLTEEEIKEAFPAITPTADNKEKISSTITKLAQDIEDYHSNWERLKEQFSHQIMPELYKGDPTRYSQMLMKKRVMDEAIEILATTSQKATKAITRAAELKDKNSQIPYLGSSVNKAFDILSNEKQLDTEIGLLTQEISLYDSLGKDPGIKDEKANARERLNHLAAWKNAWTPFQAAKSTPMEAESAEHKQRTQHLDTLKKAFNDYILADYRQAPAAQTTVDTSYLYEAFNDLGDYVALNRDSSEYIKALNILKDPKNFKSLMDRVQDAMLYAKATLSTKSAQEAADIIGVEDEDTGETEEQEEGTKPLDLETDLVDYYTKGTEQSSQVTAYLKKQKELAKLLETLAQDMEDDPEGTAKRLQETIYNYFRTIEDESIPVYTSDLYGAPIVSQNKKNKRWMVSYGQPIGAKYENSKKEANEAAKAFVKEQTKPGGKFEIFKIGDRELQKGQTLYRKDGSTVLITKLPGENGELTIETKKEGIAKTNDKAVLTPRTIGDWYNTPEEAGSSPVVPAATTIERDQDNPETTVINGKKQAGRGDKMSWNDIASVMAKDDVALSKRLLTIPEKEFNEMDLYLTVEPEKNAEGTLGKPFKNNKNIRMRNTGTQYKVSTDAAGTDVLFYIRDASNRYMFTVDRGGVPTEVPAKDLTANEMWEFFNPPASYYTAAEGNKPSLQQLYEQFKAQLDMVRIFHFELSKIPKGKPIEPAVLHKMLQFTYVPVPIYSGVNKFKGGAIQPRATLQEILAATVIPGVQTLTHDKEGLPRLVLNSSGNEKYQANKPFFGGTSDPTGKLQRSIEAISPHVVNNNQATASVPIQLQNGNIIWAELSPTKMPEEEVNGILQQVNSMITSANGEPTREIEGDATPINKLLDRLFIAFNVYETKTVDYSKKFRLSVKDIQDKKSGYWHMTLFISPTFRDKNTKKEFSAVRRLDKVQFGNVQEFVDSLNKALKEKVKGTDKLKDAHLENLYITPDSFREQVQADDMDSILKMSTNLSVQDGLVANIGLTWQYKKGQVEMLKSAIPSTTEVSIDPVIAQSLLTAEDAMQLSKEQSKVITDLVNAGKLNKKNRRDLSEIQKAVNKYLGTTRTQEQVLEQESDNPIEVPIGDNKSEVIAKARADKKRLAEVAAGRRGKRKILSQKDFDSYSVKNIDKFLVWAGKNLPESVQVEVGTIANNLKNNNITIGQFLFQFSKLGKVQGGKITVGERSPFRYHEAFHAVFNLLLTDEEIGKYLQIAKRENPVTDKQIEEFLLNNPEYSNETRETLSDLVAEEYIADRFEQWKQNKSANTSFTLKGLFARLMDWIKNMISKLTNSSLEGLFSEIDRGKYRNSDLQDNQFTRIANPSVTLPKNKVIQVGWIELPDGTPVPKTLPQQTADNLSAAIAGIFVNRLDNDPLYQKKGVYDKNKLLDTILDEYRDMLDWEKREDWYTKEVNRNIKDPVAREQWWLALDERYTLFKEKEGRDAIKESVDEYLRVMGLRQSLEEDAASADEAEYGPVNTEKLERESAFYIGGQDSMPSQVRKLIGSVVYPISETPGKHDEFFNTTFLNGEPIVQAVNAAKVYNGMMKLMANISDTPALLRKMVDYVDQGDNPETIRFINQVFSMTGFDPVVYKESNYAITATKNQGILQQVIKAFNQYEVKGLFVGADLNNNEYTISDANVKDAAYYTMGVWQSGFNEIFHDQYTKKDTKTFVKQATHPLRILKQYLNGTNTQLEDTELQEAGKELSVELLEKLGLSIHPSYIRYSILKAKKPNKITPEQLVYINSYPTVEPIYSNTINGLLNRLESDDKNLFARTDEGTSTSAQTLDKWAQGNAVFDENISMMSHTTADGKQMSNYVLPYLLGVSVGDMNRKDWLDGLTFRDEVADNPLIDDDKFQVLQDKGLLSVSFIDGIRHMGSKETQVQEYNAADDTYTESGDSVTELFGIGSEGATYKDMTSREFIITLLSMYNVNKQSAVKIYREDGSFFYNTPVPVRVPSEKGMFGLVKMPVIHSVIKKEDSLQLTNKALDILYNRIEYEFNRIKEVQQQIATGVSPKNAVVGWNVGKDPRGLKLFVTAKMSGDLKSKIEDKARELGDLEDMREEVYQQLNSYFTGQVQLMADKMIQRGLVSKDEDGQYENILAPSFLFDGLNTETDDTVDDKMYMESGDFIRNLSQVYINSYLNTTLLNNLIHGDESKLYKNAADIVKRESGTMAVLNNIEGVVADPVKGIDHALKTIYHMTYVDESVKRSLSGSDKPLDNDDGQMYHTEKGLRYILYGKGSLNTTQVRILNDLANGKKILADEIFDEGGLKDNGAFTALKLVYDDGQTYLKCSSITLFKELTSYRTKENGKVVWKPRKGREQLHELREQLEKQEQRFPESIAFAHPTSASKMLTKNVVPDISKADVSSFEPLPARFMGEQLQNPSGKVVITDPTQAKGQIMNELDDSTPVYYMGSWTDSDGKPYTVGHLKNIYLQDTAKRIQNNWVTARDGMFQIDAVNEDIQTAIATGKVTARLGRFIEHSRKNLEATGTDSQLLEFMRVEDGEPVYNINFPSILPKVTQLFFSYFSGGVLREKVPGMSLALVSPAKGLGSRVKQVTAVWTAEDIAKYQPVVPDDKNVNSLIGQPRIWTVITDNEYDRSPDTYNNVILYNNRDERLFYGLAEKLAAGETVYVLDDMRDNYLHFENGEPVGYFTEAARPAHFKEEIGGIPGSMKKSFGTRIPSVDKNSYTAFMFVDTLPAYMGSVLVTAREYYERTGADNDIDKDYVSIPDTYVDKGKRVAYGTAKEPQDQFNEYIAYQLQNNKDLKEFVREGMKDDAVQDLITELKLTEKQQSDLVARISGNVYALQIAKDPALLYQRRKDLLQQHKEGAIKAEALVEEVQREMISARNFYIKAGLKAQGLPTTTQEFISAGGPKINNGVLNNRILAAKIGMLNNRVTVQYNNTPTTTKPIQDYIKEMQGKLEGAESEYGKEVLKRLGEVDIDTNGILGMDADRDAFMTGAQSIGSIATTNIVYAFLNDNKIAIRDKTDQVTIDGHTYNTFSHNKAWDGKGYEGERIFSTLGAITNVMTDNPKERDAGKLNLDKTATGYLGYLISTGMPKETALWYALQPAIAKFLDKKTGYTIQTDEERESYISSYIADRIQELQDEKVKPKKKLTTQDLVDNIRDGGKDLSIELSVLMDLQKMEKQAETMFKVARIIRLTQGFQPSMEDFDQLLSDLNDLGIQVKDGKMTEVPNKEFKEMNVVVDIRKALLQDNKIMSSILQSVNELNSMMPSMFLERTKLFRDMTEGANKTLLNAPKSVVKGAKFRRTLKYDQIGSLMLRAYKRWLSDSEIASTAGITLKNSLIYEADGILKMRKDMMDRLSEKGINNYLLSYFLVPTEASDKTGGLNLLEANTWTKLSLLQQQRLIGAYTDLYTNAYQQEYAIETHEFANTLFNYLLVKDGGQFSNGSFIKMLPPFVFIDIMNRLGEVNDVLYKRDQRLGNKVFGEGVDSARLFNDFMRTYSKHIGNKKYLANLYVQPDMDITRSADNQKEYSKLSPADKKIVDAHLMEGKKVIGSHIDPVTKIETLEVNIYGGIPYEASKEAKSVMTKDNLQYLSTRGIIQAENGVAFPWAYNYKGILYALQEVTKKDKGVRRGNLIDKDQTTPQGIKVVYAPDMWTGSMRQWRGADSIDPVPLYKKTVYEQKQEDIGQAMEVMQESEYREGTYQITTAQGIETRAGWLNSKGEILKDEYGKAVYKATDAARVIESKKNPMISAQPVVSSQPMQPNLFSQKKGPYTGVKKVISGGQTGVDVAGLDAALEVGILTGGTAAAGYTQSTGPKSSDKISNKELATKYGLIEGKITKKQGQYGPYDDVYSQRTVANAQEADGTIWFGNETSPGGKLTLGANAQRGKPKPLVNPTSAEQIKQWLVDNNIEVLNVAGNREHTNPGIYEKSKNMLVQALTGTASSQLSPAQWKEQLTAIYNSKKRDRGIVEWMKEAINYRDGVKSLRDDNDIIEDIKKCIK